MKVRCPNCDAELDIVSGLKIYQCPYCGTSIYIDSKGLLVTEEIKSDLSRSAAFEIAKNYTNKKNFNLELKKIPFYRIESDSEVWYIPAIKELFPGIQFFRPQGDRHPIKEKIPAPEIRIEDVVHKAGNKNLSSVAIIYTPFYYAKTEDIEVFIDGVTGKVFTKSNNSEVKPKGKIKEPLSLLIFAFSGLLAITLPHPVLKTLIPISFAGFYLYKKRVANG
ncbi:hypothetical protein J7L85_03600 [candidate division WOR-3 bacterium]|nr:hypothetical protein [candidate division WOR-3 bacterium]